MSDRAYRCCCRRWCPGAGHVRHGLRADAGDQPHRVSADPGALVAVLVLVDVVPGAEMRAVGSWILGTGIGDRLLDLVTEHDRLTVELAGGPGVDAVLSAACALGEDVGHVGEGDVRLDPVVDAVLDARLGVVMPRAVADRRGQRVRVVLWLDDDELAVEQVGGTEVRDTAGCLLGDLGVGHLAVDRRGVVEPHALELVGGVLDVLVVGAPARVGERLVVLGLDAGPLRAAELLGELEHPQARAVGVARDRVALRTGRARAAEGTGAAPAIEDEVDLRADLDVAAEVRHVDGPGLTGGRRGRHTARDRRRWSHRQAGEHRRRLNRGADDRLVTVDGRGLADRVHDRRLVVRHGRVGLSRLGRGAGGVAGQPEGSDQRDTGREQADASIHGVSLSSFDVALDRRQRGRLSTWTIGRRKSLRFAVLSFGRRARRRAAQMERLAVIL